MSVATIKKSSLWALLLASVCSQTLAVYPDVGSMLDALAPTAAVTAPELNTLIIAINALPTYQQKFDALQTLIPSADGSLIAASEGPMRQMQSVLYDRLVRVKKNDTGISSGDDQHDVTPKHSIAQTKQSTDKVKDTETKKAEIADKGKGTTAAKQSESKLEVKKSEAPQKTENHKEAVADQKKENKVTEKTEVKAEAKPEAEANAEAKPETEAKIEDQTTSSETVKIENETTDSESETTTAEVKVINPADIKKGVWIQLLGNNTGQDWRDNVPGYDADVLGVLIGRDHLFTPNLTVGLAIGYVHSDVDSRGPSGSFLEIKRFQGTLYAGYNYCCPFFLHGSLTVAYNDYDNNRYILVPPVGGVPFVRIAWSEFDAWEANAHIETGYKWVCGGFHAIPKVMLTYSHFDLSGYVEQDAFGLDLDVKYNDMTFFPLGLGLKLEYQNEFEKAYVVPEIHAYYFHDFSRDPQTATALFTGGGFEFLSQGAPPGADSYEVGAGIAVHSDTNTGVIIQYDYAARSDYHRHCAFIKVRYEWA
ncbi:MAG: autotransporter domain-containing protein [Proteobacteria bacterium]|nr:autotransporter domain-containing protein [Pseudomonadota bacterium]